MPDALMTILEESVDKMLSKDLVFKKFWCFCIQIKTDFFSRGNKKYTVPVTIHSKDYVILHFI